MWTWGCGYDGRLGHNDEIIKLLPTLVVGSHDVAFDEQFSRAKIVMVAAGGFHSVAVSAGGGVMWVWGGSLYGQLGLGERRNVTFPVCLGAPEAFGGSIQMVSCGHLHTLVVAEEGMGGNGVLWSFGAGANGRLGLNDHNDRLAPSRVQAPRLGANSSNNCFLAASCGRSHSAAITEDGSLYTWGQGAAEMTEVEDSGDELPAAPRRVPQPGGLGHADLRDKLVPTRVLPQFFDAPVGRCYMLPREHAIAFASGTHARLGAGSSSPPSSPPSSFSCCSSSSHARLGASSKAARRGGGVGKRRTRRVQGKPAAAMVEDTRCFIFVLPVELVKRVVEACSTWPEGEGGNKQEGVARLVGAHLRRTR